jgi:hypothetical protein
MTPLRSRTHPVRSPRFSAYRVCRCKSGVELVLIQAQMAVRVSVRGGVFRGGSTRLPGLTMCV